MGSGYMTSELRLKGIEKGDFKCEMSSVSSCYYSSY